MFEFILEKDPKVFLDKYGDWLRENKVKHNLILGLCNRAINGEYPVINCIAILKDGSPCLLAIQTPPLHLILSESSGEGLETLVDCLIEKEINFPGILGQDKIVEKLTEILSKKTNKSFVKKMEDYIYVLNKVSFLVNPAEGEFSFAKESDLDLLSDWHQALLLEALPEEDYIFREESEKKVKSFINDKLLSVWRVNGEPVSCARFQSFDDMARISFVYTPKEFRGKGYASAVVAKLSQHLLDKDIKDCCLYTDASNATSNSIYTKIGYKFITDAVLYLAES